MARIIYIWQKDFPWDVRAEKVCCALRDAGHEVMILARWDVEYHRPEREVWQGIHIVRVGHKQRSAFGLPLSGNPIWIQSLKRIVHEFKPHLLIPREIMLAESAARIACAANIPVVIDMAEHYPAAMRGWKKYTSSSLSRFVVNTARIPDWVERRAVRLAHGIITVCQENSERLAREYGYPLVQTAIVHNTPSREAFVAVRAEKSSAEHADAQKKNMKSIRHFGYHGVLSGGRGLETLVRAFALVRERVPDARLTIAGDGESLPELKRMAKALHLYPHLLLTGRYAPSDLTKLYAETDVAVLPHPDNDFMNTTLPNKLFDYMACGVPVVASDVKPVHRVIGATQAGLIADCASPETLADVLTNICSMPISEYERLSQNGIKAALSQYNWETDAAVLLAFVERCLA